MNVKRLPLAALMSVLLLSGCAMQFDGGSNEPLTDEWYKWNGSTMQVADYYEGRMTRAQAIASLEQVIKTVKEQNAIVPPGVYAELGSFYLQEGDTAKALECYKQEVRYWPESKKSMTMLIASLEKSGKTSFNTDKPIKQGAAQ